MDSSEAAHAVQETCSTPRACTHDTSEAFENMDISLSPITSPNTSLLLKPSIHWYYSNPGGSWNPFSYRDSERLETAYSSRTGPDDVQLRISTDGGRYDVNMAARQRIPVYWDGLASAIRRCSWFYRGNNDIMQPYNEGNSYAISYQNGQNCSGQQYTSTQLAISPQNFLYN